MKKAATFFLAVIMAVSAVVFTACDGGGSGQTADYPDFPTTPAEKDSWEYNDEEITIEWYVDTPGFSYQQYGSDKISKVIKEKTGVNIKFTAPVSNDGQYLSNLISSGSLPDVVTLSAYTSVKDRLCTQNYIYPIDELAKRWAPTLTQRIEDDIHVFYELSDGNIYGLPSNSYSNEYNDGTAYSPNGGFLVRKDLYDWFVSKHPEVDVMSKQGFFTMVQTVVSTFSYSGTKKPEPIDGIECVRNMNGILLDQFSAEGNKSITWLAQYFAAPFEDKDGNYVDTRTTPQYKEALQFLNDAFHAGLISESNLDYNASEIGGRIATGSAFCSMVTAQDYYNSFIAAYDKGNGFEYIPIIFTNEAGDDPILQDLTGYGYLFNMITKNCKRPDIVIKLFDFLWSKEGQMLCYFGIEGETFNYTDGSKTTVEYTDLYKQMKNDGTLWDAYGNERFWLFVKTGFIEPIKPTNAYTVDLLYAENMKRPLIPISYSYNASMVPNDTSSPNYTQIVNKTYSVDMVLAENLPSIIRADKSEFEDTLSGVLSDMNKRGLQDIVEFKQASYKAFVEKLGYDKGWPAYRSGWTSRIKNADGSYKISPNGDSSQYINATPIK